MGDEDADGSMCRQRGSTGRKRRCLSVDQSRGRGLDSGRGDTPAVHMGSTGWSGSGSVGSRVVEAEEERKVVGTGWRKGDVWPVYGSL